MKPTRTSRQRTPLSPGHSRRTRRSVPPVAGSGDQGHDDALIHHAPDPRLLTRAARLYHEEGLTRTEVAHRLGITQVAVSRRPNG